MTKTKYPLVLEIKGNSLDDGPGIRTVIFFKGCPLSCAWCHNPESKNPDFEISFDKKACIGCNTCMQSCPNNALSHDNPYFINHSKCRRCFFCVSNCPSNALSCVGMKMTSEEIVYSIKKDVPFFKTSGGGVTLSGGEPMMFIDFASELVKKIKGLNIHILVETSGYFDFQSFENLIYPYIDMIYFDIKLFDTQDHKKFCKVNNEKILNNFEILYSFYLKGQIPVLPRIPLIPGITDKKDNLSAISLYFSKLGVKKVSLLPYNPLWKEKEEKLGEKGSFFNNARLNNWMKPEEVKNCRLVFEKSGIEII